MTLTDDRAGPPPADRARTTLDVTRTPDGDVAVTLRGTGAGNVLGAAFWAEFAGLMGDLRHPDDPDDAGCLVLRGAGRDFSAGLDLRWYLRRLIRARRTGDAPATVLDDARRMRAALAALEDGPRVSIALIDGECTGAGLELALACDLRIATRSAVFCLPEADLGILPDLGGLQRLPRLIGGAAARRRVLTGAPIGAREALRCGLVSDVADSAAGAESVVAGHRAAVRGKPADVLSTARRHLLDGTGPDEAARWNSERLASGDWERRMGERLAAGRRPEGATS